MAKINHVPSSGGVGISFKCPGCQDLHYIPVKPHPRGWDLSGTDDKPTVAPSILIYETKVEGQVIIARCHSFVRDGKIQFLSDCGHPLAGETVDLPDV